jgi:hypothetical protein
MNTPATADMAAVGVTTNAGETTMVTVFGLGADTAAITAAVAGPTVADGGVATNFTRMRQMYRPPGTHREAVGCDFRLSRQ